MIYTRHLFTVDGWTKCCQFWKRNKVVIWRWHNWYGPWYNLQKWSWTKANYFWRLRTTSNPGLWWWLVHLNIYFCNDIDQIYYRNYMDVFWVISWWFPGVPIKNWQKNSPSFSPTIMLTLTHLLPTQCSVHGHILDKNSCQGPFHPCNIFQYHQWRLLGTWNGNNLSCRSNFMWFLETKWCQR